MPSPKIERHGQAIKIVWPDQGVELFFDRITERTDGTHAEVTPTLNGANSPTPRLLTPSRINLLSHRSREDWCKRTRKIAGDTSIAWDTLLEDSVHFVLRTHRTGEPAVLLNEASYPQKSHIIQPLVYENLPSTVFGMAAKGKSLFSLFLCLLAECGQSLCGFTVTQSHQTLFLDWELDQSVQGFRKQQIVKAHPQLETAGPLYRRMYRSLSDELPRITQLVQEHGVSFIVIDSLAPATGGDQIGADGALRFFEALRILNVGCLVLAHAPKNTEIKSIYGNVFNYNLSRSVWEIQTAQEENSDEIRMGFYHRKNNLGRLHPSFGLKLTFPPEGGELETGLKFQAYDLSEDGELSQSLPLRKRLLHILKQGAQTVKELNEKLGVDQTKIRARLNEGKGKMFTRIQAEGNDPKWGLLHP